eukprot:6401648-Prymnesium_polylepis.1
MRAHTAGRKSERARARETAGEGLRALGVLRLVVGVRRVAADRREARERLLVDGHLASVARHEDAHLALVDARQQALVDELAARLLAALRERGGG